MENPVPFLSPRYLRTPDAAVRLGLSPRTLEKHRCYGTGPAFHKLGGRVVYSIEALDAWAAALRTRFELAEDDLPSALVLDLARDVANGVARPAAPFSAFAAGLVAGRAGGTPDDVRAAVAAIVELAEAWPRGES